MRNRILEFLKNENKTSAQFAEEIGVQPSGISHILSGRNNPSLDFIIKMLEKYPFLSTEWLLFGKGFMYKERFAGTLFGDSEMKTATGTLQQSDRSQKKEHNLPSVDEAGTSEFIPDVEKSQESEVIKIVWFYRNNTFEEFVPHND